MKQIPNMVLLFIFADFLSTWETTIERKGFGMTMYDFTFDIVVDFAGTKFSGTCTCDSTETWKWNGAVMIFSKDL